MRDLPVNKQRGTRRSLESALIRIAERRQLSAVNAADYKVLHIIEGVAHELAHDLDLGPDFEAALRAMEDAEANEREAAALRIEIAALAALGVRLSARRLWATTNWQNTRIPFTQLSTPLDCHERSCVKRFVIMVKRAVMETTRARRVAHSRFADEQGAR